MRPDYDVIIVGSGPAGVSAAFPLVAAGLRVLMLDGGKQATQAPPSEDFLSWRSDDETQSKWLVGKQFHSLKMHDAVSPKLRVPSLDYVFDGFSRENRIAPTDFVAIGSLATGGLSNAWGCGVATLSDNELASFPCATAEMRSSYAAVATRIGISGGVDDDMSDYFGLDAWAGPAIGLDEPHDYLHRHYAASKSKLQRFGFTMGRSRVAVLSEDLNGRKACSKSGNCLWGCQRGALYTAADELIALRKFPNFRIQHGFVVKRVTKEMDTWTVEGLASNGTESRAVTAPKVLLAAGTLATTRLALDALRSNAPVPLLSCPTAAFLLWLPRLLGAQRKAGFGLGQLSYHLKLSDGTNGFGSTFSATGIPVSEFVRHLPLRRRLGIDILQNLLSSCLVGNIFLPGHFSMAQAKLEGDGSLAICGGYNTVVPDLMKEAASTLRSAYQKIGAIMLPMSFTPGRPGGDIHYAGTFPMKMKPIEGETNFLGELCGLSGLHVIDGACLPILSEKSHTLTIMANAHRIAAQIGQELRDELANARSRQ